MIRAEGIYCGYHENDVLFNVSLEIPASGFTALLGPNGAGKSTLLYALMGYLKIRKGKIFVMGKDLYDLKQEELAKIIAYIPQEAHSEFDYSVLDTVLMGRYPFMDFFGSYSQTDISMAESTLHLLNLWDFRQRYVRELSGGEKQRVYIARALVQETPYIFLDESLSQLDINYQLEIMRLLKKICTEQNKSILLISHNINLSANYADMMIFLKDGKILDVGTPNELMQSEKLSELFSVPLTTGINPLTKINNIIYP
nr:iron complex transport system ATP-binding protein [Candidatus Cloacimonadota bacterium]